MVFRSHSNVNRNLHPQGPMNRRKPNKTNIIVLPYQGGLDCMSLTPFPYKSMAYPVFPEMLEDEFCNNFSGDLPGNQPLVDMGWGGLLQ
jgi:hypothetical protein